MRIASCASCGKERPSSTELPFFQDRSKGSRAGTDTCKHCRYAPAAHERKKEGAAHLQRSVCDNFEPIGEFPTDSFYCGCRGWD